MKIYGIKTCDTCRKAVKQTGGELVDIRATPLDRATLERLEAAFGEALVNRRSTTWRGLTDAERALPPLDLIAAHPSVMKRPVIEGEGVLLLGFDAKTKAALGLG